MVEKIIPWCRKAIDYAMNGIRSLLGGGRPNGGAASPNTNAREEEPEIEVKLKEPEPRFEVAGEGPSVEGTSAAPEVVSEVETQIEPVAGYESETEIAAPIEAQAVNDELPVAAGEPEDSEVKLKSKLEVEGPAESAQQTIAEVRAILETVDEVEAEAVTARVVFAVVATEKDPGAIPAVEKAELAAQKVISEVTAAEPGLDLATEAALTPEAEPEPTIESAADDLPVASTDPVVKPVVVAATKAPAESVPAAADAIGASIMSSDSKALPQLESVKSESEQKTAARVAAAIKAREESADPSPFSVFVGQVYDGPLDLLLDLIRKQDIDIYDIPIAKITAQFLAYVNQLKASDMDVAGEFIYTASLLIHIKSKMLLPRTTLGPDDAAEDPRRELVERLLEHERFKNAAQMLQQKQMLEAATWTNPGVREFREDAGAEPEIAADTTDLVRVFQEILERARNRPIINVEEDSVTVGQMIQFLARRLIMEDKPVALHKLLSHTRSERALIAMFLALLELVRLQAILLRQDRHFSEIFVKKHSGFEAAMDQGLAGARDDWR